MISSNLVGKEAPTLMNKLLSTLSSLVNKSSFFCKFSFSVDSSCTLCSVSCCFFLALSRLLRTAMLFLTLLSRYSSVPFGGCFFLLGRRGPAADGFLPGRPRTTSNGDAGGVSVEELTSSSEGDGEPVRLSISHVLNSSALLADQAASDVVVICSWFDIKSNSLNVGNTLVLITCGSIYGTTVTGSTDFSPKMMLSRSASFACVELFRSC
mmetsp:Transcript_592/g.764  ORF Transcript_592/g.764 Transcript_592/m.764 type:complete len:210 (+) Transcript_592:224-853(+)